MPICVQLIISMTVTVPSAEPSCLKATILAAGALLIFCTGKELSSCQHICHHYNQYDQSKSIPASLQKSLSGGRL